VARYQYAGPGPVPDPESNEIVRPGDVREFDEEPAWGPWELLDPEPEPEADECGQPPSPPEASPAALSAAPALNITPAPAVTPKGF
jgi:hypothetical protein